jgi:tRNA modification GTPase
VARFPSRTLRRVSIVDQDGGRRLDDALCVVMRAPRSYTGEDVVEIHAHGGPALLQAIVTRLRSAGARLAGPGEFTRRAFVNGRLDLARAEAVAMLISARTERAVQLAARALGGELGRRVSRLRDDLLEIIAGLEVTLDFPEERVGLDAAVAAERTERLAREVTQWRDGARRARVVHDGLTVAIVGPPNAGKSSLMNTLAGGARAIVAPTPGTTRDVLDATIVVGGVPIRLLDTAGIGAATDPIEAEGVRRSRKAIAESDILLVVVDGSIHPDLLIMAETANRQRLVVRAKADLPVHPDAHRLDGAIPVSVLTGLGLSELLSALAREVASRAGAESEETSAVASLRQTEAIEALYATLDRSAGALRDEPLEGALVDLHAALRAVSDLLGVNPGDDVLDRIFATFCLGK